MDRLDADCLIPIFQNLNFFERVRLEAVCYKWFCILQMHAAYSNVTQLNVADFLTPNSSNYYQQESLSLAPTVVGIVQRCGCYVTNISFGQRWLKISKPIIDTIADHCVQLRELDLGCTILNADISTLLEKTAENLEVFSLEETSWTSTNHGDKVQDYFHKMKRLKKLNVRRAMFKLDKLHELPECLQSIEISGSHSFPSEVFNKFLATHPYLEELGVCPLPVSDSLTVPYISNLPALKDLELGYILKEANDLPMQPLAFCVSIQNLLIRNCNALTSHSLRLLLNGLCNLRSLTIINCIKVYDYSSLSLCRFLEALHIGHTVQISDDDLLPFAIYKNLKSLTITRCYNITNASILPIVRNCALSEITLVDCEGINDEVMYSLAASQHVINTIAVQGCWNITSKGVAALALLKNISSLRELDVSHNRSIDDMAILSLHNGLEMSQRQENCRSGEKETRKDGSYKPNSELCPTLTVYVFKTSVSRMVEERVGNLITITN